PPHITTMCPYLLLLFFSNATPPTDISTLSLHDALPISPPRVNLYVDLSVEPARGGGHEKQARDGCGNEQAQRRTPVAVEPRIDRPHHQANRGLGHLERHRTPPDPPPAPRIAHHEPDGQTRDRRRHGEVGPYRQARHGHRRAEPVEAHPDQPGRRLGRQAGVRGGHG